MEVHLLPATGNHEEIFLNLFQYYIYDMSQFTGQSVNGSGKFHFDKAQLDKYWERDEHWAYLIYRNNDIAGFCLIRKYPGESDVYDIEQFFILNSFRNKGIGKQVFNKLMADFSGKWLIRILKENSDALQFWLSVIGHYVGNQYSQTVEMDDELEMQFIRYESSTVND